MCAQGRSAKKLYGFIVRVLTEMLSKNPSIIKNYPQFFLKIISHGVRFCEPMNYRASFEMLNMKYKYKCIIIVKHIHSNRGNLN